MILCIGDSVPTTTDKSKILRRILIFILVIHICISVAKIYQDLWTGVAESISCYILLYQYCILLYISGA